ncbi:MAG: YraN family protein [Myxococcales bacterium]|nr:YraN family protein [Myxococcales bacterium]
MGPMDRRSLGTAAEARAISALEQAGYRIVERNVRLRVGELDAVAWDGDVLVFVEVRSRADTRFGGAGQAVGLAKQRQVARCAEAYLGRSGGALRPRGVRFDVVAITGAEVVILRDAFRAS